MAKIYLQEIELRDMERFHSRVNAALKKAGYIKGYKSRDNAFWHHPDKPGHAIRQNYPDFIVDHFKLKGKDKLGQEDKDEDLEDKHTHLGSIASLYPEGGKSKSIDDMKSYLTNFHSKG